MINVQLPDKRVISVQTDDPQAAAMAGRRLLAREAILKSGMGGGRRETGLGQAATAATGGASLGLSSVVDGAENAGITGVKNLIMRAQGQTPTYGMADAYAADRGLLKDRAAEHPVASASGGLLGALAMPGGEQLAGLVSKGLPVAADAVKDVPVVGGLLKGILSSRALPAVAVRGGVTGAPVGAVSGAANADPGQELQGAATGAKVGAVTGAALPLATAGAGAAVGTAKNTGTAIVRAGNKVSGAMGGPTLDATRTAGQRLTAALKADGASGADLRNIQNEWLRTGASSPTVMDLASKLPSGGANTMRLLTGAAMKGNGAGAASTYAEGVKGALPDNVIDRARQLTPDTRPAAAVADDLTARQSDLATKQYAGPYATPVPVTPEITAAVADQPGRNAIQGAIDTATARQDYASADRLKGLLQVHESAPLPVSGGNDPGDLSSLQAAIARARTSGLNLTAGDLDRIRINLGEAGEGALRGQTPNRGAAGGYFDRAAQLNGALDQVPEIQPARQTYKAMQAQRDALDTGSGAMAAMPDDYEASIHAAMDKATPADNPHPVSAEDIQQAAAIGHRQAITDAVGAPAAGGTGAMSKLVSSPNQIRNQDASFGPESAGDFRDAVSNELTRLRNARQIDPTGGSQTAGRLDAMDDLSIPARPSFGGVVMGLINKVRQGATLTDREREAVVHLGLSTPDPAQLDQFEPDPAKLLDLLHRSGALVSTPVASLFAGDTQ